MMTGKTIFVIFPLTISLQIDCFKILKEDYG